MNAVNKHHRWLLFVIIGFLVVFGVYFVVDTTALNDIMFRSVVMERQSPLQLLRQEHHDQPKTIISSIIPPTTKVEDSFKGAFPCADPNASTQGRVEDLFCQPAKSFLPNVKNPCFYEGRPSEPRRLHCLPYYFILGMDKCGSTDLYNRMANHPQINKNTGAINKEAMFWTWKRYGIQSKKNMTLGAYMGLFKATSQQLEKNMTKGVVTGDASPMDFYDFRRWPLIPQNKGLKEPVVLMPQLLKHVYGSHTPKMILIFRDPIERLFSLYMFQGKIAEKFHADVVKSLALLKDCLRNNKDNQRPCYFTETLVNQMPVKIHTSCYSIFIREWLKEYSKEDFLITYLRESSRNMTTALKSIFDYLELDPLPSEKLQQIAAQERKYVTKSKIGKTVKPQTAALLRKFYEPYNQEAAQLLQDDRLLWKDTA